MNVLAGALVEAELKIPGKKLVFYSVAARRKYAIAAVIGKFEADHVSLPCCAVTP